MSDTRSLAIGDTIGILGGGQLGRMLAQAAATLGLKTHIFCPDPASPAFDVAYTYTVAAYDDKDALEGFAKSCCAITYEFENVPGETATFLESQCVLRPGAKALEVSQDRLFEKEFLTSAGVAIAPFADIKNEADLQTALSRFGGKGVLKTRRFGYDGKGQVMIREASGAQGALAHLNNAPAVLEGLIAFDREVSVIVARDASGTCAAYELTENRHEHHILDTSTVPANASEDLRCKAKEMAVQIANKLNYVGVMGAEMFVVPAENGGEEQLLVNEIAPRVHNSGHWTQDACLCSQFEQHIRAVAGWKLGSCERHSDVVMQNLIGDQVNAYADILSEPNAKLHLYGKAEARPGRKMGHVNRTSPRA
ncbi:phosphoribosylaminoimidazole carboxylase, ATPase subunit [Roseibium sp. TrichSKD4]|uniref:5-(carboxyamino)imidazole ribonucleotide synthase n=1 Tax=Roseibium sp. TrichSKD4 TaxID=744980 RepID=UPI0001E56CEC|nr:5-(carboxyamino)imidazole ribonucleotide synthase [Roseibium sp. TrichSKD4]EFO31467.1 phosphoribosylaminoimidazole carboxylase, ATPase subunit [Roseibium sp. TrichSKD4]